METQAAPGGMNGFRQTFRQLLRHRAFALVAVVVLGLAIGVNTGVFSVVNAVLLRPLPVHDPGALRLLNWSGPLPRQYSIAGDEHLPSWQGSSWCGEFSGPVYTAFRDQDSEGCRLFAFAPTDPITVTARDGTSRATGILVSGGFFAAYQGPLGMGRPLLVEDDTEGAAPVVVISHRWWARHCASAPDSVGRSLMLNGTSFTVVGILPRDFRGPLPGDTADLYLPLAFQALFRPDYRLSSPDDYWLQIMLRLRPTVDERQVGAALESAFRRHQLELAEPGSDPPRLLFCPGARGPWMQRLILADPLTSLTWISAIALLTACANVAGLMLARHASRQHELAVRAALGASRWQLAWQVGAECIILASASTGLGLLLSWWCKSALVGLLGAFTTYDHFDFTLDARVLGFLALLAVTSVLLVGFVPALFAARSRPVAGLRSTRIAGAPRLRYGRWLVLIQVATSVVLLSGSGMMARTLLNLRRVEVGFKLQGLQVFQANAAQAGYATSELPLFYERLRERIESLPGVKSAAFADQSHLGAGFGTGYVITLPGREGESIGINGVVVSDTFLDAMRIPLLGGRGFGLADGPEAPRVAVVNLAFAEALFPAQNVLGKTFRLGERDHEVVGLCGNARLYSARTGQVPIAYLSYRQRPAPEAWYVLRTTVAPLLLESALRGIVGELDPKVATTSPIALSDLVDREAADERMLAVLGGALALLALALACVGLYGLTSYEVARRVREIGVRLALGARPADVALWILRQTVALVGLGAIIGVAVSFGAVQLIRHHLYQVGPHDPLTLVLAVLLLVATALLAALLPARRASRIDPMEALRAD